MVTPGLITVSHISLSSLISNIFSKSKLLRIVRMCNYLKWQAHSPHHFLSQFGCSWMPVTALQFNCLFNSHLANKQVKTQKSTNKSQGILPKYS